MTFSMKFAYKFFERLARITRKKISRQILFFLTSGISANIISFFSYTILYKILFLRADIASFIGQILALYTSYFINSRITFKKVVSFKYKIIYYLYYFSTIIIISTLIQKLVSSGLEYRISWVICVSIAPFFNFLFIKFFVFESK